MGDRFGIAMRASALAFAALGLLFLSTLAGVRSDFTPAVALSLGGGLGSAAMATLAFAGASLWPGRAAARLGLLERAPNPRIVAALAIGTVGLSHLLDGALEALDLRGGSVLEQIEAILGAATPPELVLAAVCIAVAPGIGEELLFRGLLLRSLVRRGRPVAAIALSAALFGAIHLDPAQSLAAGLLGVYLGVVALATGGIRAPIACHIANNLAAIAAMGLAPDAAPGPGSTIVATAAFALGLAALRRIMRRPPATGFH